MSGEPLAIARRFAAALDAEDYWAARELIAEGCVYYPGNDSIIGRDAIIETYRSAGESAKRRFDAIHYVSDVELSGPSSAVISFTDHLCIGSESHEFRCRQHVRIRLDSLIEEIRHEELPDERQRLDVFEAARSAVAEDRIASRTDVEIQTKNLRLVLKTPEEVLAMIEAMGSADKTHLSADWLAQVHASTSPDPWVHGFSMVHRETGVVIGSCGFKGPPAEDGAVEIAYGVDANHQGKGYATEAADALAKYAFGDSRVRVVRAHTLPQANASTRVLGKCGFRPIGEVIDPEDGLVWRWEKRQEGVAIGC